MPSSKSPRDQRPDSSKVHRVPATDAGSTVAAFLRRSEPPLSWAAAGKLVRGRRVMIDGNICNDEARRLKGGEVVKVLASAAPAPPKAEDVDIIYLDDAVAIVEKPSGLTTTRHHEELSWPARRRQLQPTLDEMLPGVIARTLARSGRQSGQGSRKGKSPRVGPVRPVHRIDRETSGLLVFARSIPAGRILAEQFRLHSTHRRYIAICIGRITARTIRSQLVRDRGDGRRGSTEGDHGKEAVTHVQPLEHFGNDFTLVECRLETGRTHQIRIHLSEEGHPVCGERVYTSPRGRRIKDNSGARRVMLHAAELGFVHPVSGEEMRFSSPMPDDFKRLLARLRAQTTGNA
ncbi:MAG: RluA family pseudouridine synthase [Pirellulales bacterium]|jgi:23S rRNA pseudouridine1911/1915/1917 synthase|nr:RluA family pseudouridine synthase [Pirellulales bacterium]